jgi:nicotinate-nucleotide--dimethylbenzimidazole phosphoribosyltransferase
MIAATLVKQKVNNMIQQIFERVASISPLDTEAMELARSRQQQLTKPAGSLGRLEDIAIQVAGITRQPIPIIKQKAVIIMAADHGVTIEGVSAYPSAVTPQMVHNFLQGGAAINALAQTVGAKVIVVDIGVADAITHPDLLSRKVASGTANMALEPAMTRAQMLEAIQVGIDVCDAQLDHGIDLVATGDMGIGNTTASSAIAAVLLQKPVTLVTGRGTGIDEEQLAHKIQVIEKAIERNLPNPQDPLDVLMKVGGLEIAGLVGVIIAAASRRVPVVIDGFISGAASLVAVALNPLMSAYLFAGHVSVEQGHRLILEKLELSALLDLQLRLGEGTGAILAMSIIEAALHAHREMATFAEAGVSIPEEK